jgi:hypothetical protein
MQTSTQIWHVCKNLKGLADMRYLCDNAEIYKGVINMAGSLKWFSYQSDDGTDWAFFGDESNIEAANGNGFNGSPPGQNFKPPSNLRVRYAVYGNLAGTRNIRVPVMSQAIYNALDAASTIPSPDGAETLNLIRKRPELISPIPTIFDTGLDDGDQP